MKDTLEIRDCKGLVAAAIEIGRARQNLIQQMRFAFERGDNSEAMRLGKELCGIEERDTSN